MCWLYPQGAAQGPPAHHALTDMVPPACLQEAVSTATFVYTHHCEEPEASDKPTVVQVSAEVLTCSLQGPLKAADVFKLAELCRVGCQRVGEFTHASLEKTFKALLNR